MSSDELERKLLLIKQEYDELTKIRNDKKISLAPILQELRELQQKIQTVELAHSEKQRNFDAALMGLET